MGGRTLSTSVDRDPFFPLPPSVRALAEKAARVRVPVLITGETGTGKSMLAELIHRWGPRAGKPFVTVDCAALADTLAESELFGHKKGAFTDAKTSRVGLIPAAGSGTVFFDEIGVLRPPVQVMLLTVLEEREVRPVGATAPVRIDARPICATNEDLVALIEQGRFREDLYYRCCGIRISMPPLRKRRDEIAALVLYLLKNHVEPELEGLIPGKIEISEAALDVLRKSLLHGNFRQLKWGLIQAALNSGGGRIEPHHLPSELVPGHSGHRNEANSRGPKRYKAPSDPAEERASIISALRESGGNRKKAAQELGMARTTLYDRIHRYAIDVDEIKHRSRQGS